MNFAKPEQRTNLISSRFLISLSRKATPVLSTSPLPDVPGAHPGIPMQYWAGTQAMVFQIRMLITIVHPDTLF